MTGHELLVLAGQHPQGLAALLGAPVVTALALQLSPTAERPRGPSAYLWSAVVYAASVPGIFATVTLFYAGFVLRQNLLELDLLVAFGPIATMSLTLGLVRRKVAIASLPGVDRLGGMLMMLAATFALIYILDRTRIMVLFHGGIGTLALVALALFLLFKFGLGRLLGGRPPRPEY